MHHLRALLIVATTGLLVLLPSADSTPARANPALRAAPLITSPTAYEKASFKHRRRGVRILLPVGPAYIYQDYPYAYSRGFYPSHIGGYVYYPYHPYYTGGYRHWDIRRKRSDARSR